jgi:hypothetical protein
MASITTFQYLSTTPNYEYWSVLPVVVSLLCFYHLSTVALADLEILRALATNGMQSSTTTSAESVVPPFSLSMLQILLGKYEPFKKRMLYVLYCGLFIIGVTLVVLWRLVLFYKLDGTWSTWLGLFSRVVNVIIFCIVSCILFTDYAEEKWRIAVLLYEKKQPSFRLGFAIMPVLFHTTNKPRGSI